MALTDCYIHLVTWKLAALRAWNMRVWVPRSVLPPQECLVWRGLHLQMSWTSWCLVSVLQALCLLAQVITFPPSAHPHLHPPVITCGLGILFVLSYIFIWQNIEDCESFPIGLLYKNYRRVLPQTSATVPLRELLPSSLPLVWEIFHWFAALSTRKPHLCCVSSGKTLALPSGTRTLFVFFPTCMIL